MYFDPPVDLTHFLGYLLRIFTQDIYSGYLLRIFTTLNLVETPTRVLLYWPQLEIREEKTE